MSTTARIVVAAVVSILLGLTLGGIVGYAIADRRDDVQRADTDEACRSALQLADDVISTTETLGDVIDDLSSAISDLDISAVGRAVERVTDQSAKIASFALDYENQKAACLADT